MLECLALIGTTVSPPPRLRESMEKKAERTYELEVGEVDARKEMSSGHDDRLSMP